MVHCDYKYICSSKKGQECGKFIRKKGETRCFKHKRNTEEKLTKNDVIKPVVEEKASEMTLPVENLPKTPKSIFQMTEFGQAIQKVKDEHIKTREVLQSKPVEIPKEKRVYNRKKPIVVESKPEPIVEEKPKKNSPFNKKRILPTVLKQSKLIQLKCDTSSTSSSISSDSSDIDTDDLITTSSTCSTSDTSSDSSTY